MTLRAGVAVRDIKPSPGVAMSGFVARQSLASGAHDPLFVYALVVNDTALVTVDVIGLHEDDCTEIRRRCRLPAGNVVVHATHTHGGPVSMRGRLGDKVDLRDRVDEEWLERVIQACVDCVDGASVSQEAVELVAGYGASPGVARNRRRSHGPVDDALPVILLYCTDGSLLAGVVSYACHPVVLGADNTRLTADYPGVVRRLMTEQLRGAPVLFVTGCAGDANTGHLAAASITTTASADRTFEACERVGGRIAAAGLGFTSTARSRRSGAAGVAPVAAASGEVLLRLEVPDRADVLADIERWEQEAVASEPAHAALLDCWANWGRALVQDAGSDGDAVWLAPVTVLRWGGAVMVALPGEPFAETARQIRKHVRRTDPETTVLVAGYSNGCPGYLPTADEYPIGGYEVCDAHRYYGMPGRFASGSLEALVQRATQLLDAV